MLLLLRCSYYREYRERLLFKTNRQSRQSIPIISWLQIGRENCRCSQILWQHMKMLLKQETQQTFVNGLLGFITLGIYTPLEARVYCSQ